MIGSGRRIGVRAVFGVVGSRRKSSRGERRRAAILRRVDGSCSARSGGRRGRLAEAHVATSAAVGGVVDAAGRQRVAAGQRAAVALEARRLRVDAAATAAVFQLVARPEARRRADELEPRATLLATDDDEDGDVEQQQGAADRHRDAQGDVDAGQPRRHGHAAGLGRRHTAAARSPRRGCRRRRGRSPSGGRDGDSDGDGGRHRRGARRGGRRGGRGGQIRAADDRLVGQQASRSVSLECRLVVVIVEQVEATVQLVRPVNLRNQLQPQRHLCASVSMPSDRTGTCTNIILRGGYKYDSTSN